ncbi:MAG TPA: aspartate dehydrogenase domain-containing protein [Alphaproteobacteria bacterium]|jgi:aspartate dehydrogenase
MAAESKKPLKIGLIGAGTIGKAIADAAQARADLELAWVCTRDANKARAWLPNKVEVLTDVERAVELDVDLVVEAAMPDVMKAATPLVLKGRNLLAFSLTPLADQAFHDAADALAKASGTCLFVPHGAIIGLDGIAAARSILSAVTIRTIKSPQSMGLPPDSAGVVFDGSTREATQKFPRNVNVHAAVALAGLGFDRTRSLIVSEPGLGTMRHEISVEGADMKWSIAVESRSLGGVTGAFTPLSALESVLRHVPAQSGIVMNG